MNQEIEMNDESSAAAGNESSQASQSQPGSSQQNKRKRNNNRKKNRGGAANQGNNAPEENKEAFYAQQQQQPRNNNNTSGGKGGGNGGGNRRGGGQGGQGGQPQYQKKGQGAAGQQQQQMMNAGPTRARQHGAGQGGQAARLNLDERPVQATTEEGFTGDSETWFDDAEYRRQMFDDFGERDKHDYYYGSYSSFHIHEEMLKDTVRTRSYQRAIMDNPDDFKDKIVMDIGAGTGILSIFAAKAGAKHVYAIEFAEIATFAREIIRRNNLQHKITVIKGKMEEIELPVPKVDIIISEWMGYFLLYESMLDSVLWARDRYLNPGGKMLPDRAQLYIAAIEDGQYKQQKMTFWNDVYGVDMSVLTPTVMKEPLVDTVDSNMIMSDSCKILDLDLVNCNKGDVNFTAAYELRMKYTDRVHGLVAWFDTPFSNLQRPVMLSTSPYKKYTHWKQTVFYMEQDIDVCEGDVIYGSVACRQSKANHRELDVKISYNYNAPGNLVHFHNLYKVK